MNISELKKTQITQTEDTYDILFTKYYEQNSETLKLPNKGCDINIDYEVDSEISKSENKLHNNGVVVVSKTSSRTVDNLLDNLLSKTAFTKQYFDTFENNLINEIAHRKGVKRKSEMVEKSLSKICKMDRRKNRIPKKLHNCIETNGITETKLHENGSSNVNNPETSNDQVRKED